MMKAEALRANFYEIVASLTWHSQPLSIATFLKLLFICTGDTYHKRAKQCLYFIAFYVCKS